jgi:hypothetical protein
MMPQRPHLRRSFDLGIRGASSDAMMILLILVELFGDCVREIVVGILGRRVERVISRFLKRWRPPADEPKDAELPAQPDME